MTRYLLVICTGIIFWVFQDLFSQWVSGVGIIKILLHIYGPIGLEKVKESIFNLGYFTIDFPVIIHEIENDGNEITTIFENDEYVVECIKTQHNVTNISYSIYEKKKPRF